MVRDLGIRIGIIYPEVRACKDLTLPSLLLNRFQVRSYEEAHIPTLRMHGWNISPGFLKGTMLYWKKQAIRLFKNYIDIHGKPNLIHAQSALWGGVAAKAISEAYHIPYVLTEHRDNFLQETLFPNKKNCAWLLALMETVFDNAEQVVAVSHSLKKGIAKYMQRPKSEPIIIPNFIDTTFFCPSPTTVAPSFTFLTIAHLFKNKNVDVLIDAFHALQKNDRHCCLNIGGDGPERKFLEEKVKKLGLDSQVQFLGKLSRKAVKGALATAQAFVLPSQFETFGIVLIEALSMGLPVISTYSGGPEEIIQSHVGKLVPSNHTEALSAAMIDLKQNHNHYPPEKLRDYAVSHFGKHAIASKLADFYIRHCKSFRNMNS
jgi:glycosyltransferase involved in cell wall biosynthesis